MSQTSSLKHSIYEYNPQTRMVRSRVIDDLAVVGDSNLSESRRVLALLAPAKL